MAILSPSPARAPGVLRGVAALGLLAALVGGVVGWVLLGQVGVALEDSLDLTRETLVALDASAGVASESLEALGASLGALERTAGSLDTAFDDGEALLTELSTVVREDVADALAAVDDTLPGLIRVAGTIDGTLATLSSLPFGPSYDPEQSFADALRGLETSLDGLPTRLREQADLIDTSAANLGEVGRGVSALAAELSAFDEALVQSAALLSTYDETIAEGTLLVQEASASVGSQLRWGRAAVVLLALAFAAGQLVPLQMAALAATVSDSRDGGSSTTP